MIIRPLTLFEREAVRSFYFSLSAGDRRKRFCCALGDENVAKYADGLDFTRDTILGAFDEQAHLVGLAELIRGAEASEMAFSVRSDRQGQKIGTMLMQRLLARARLCGARKVFVMFLSDNTPMRRMALRAGMAIQTADGESYAARELQVPSAEELTRWLIVENMSHSGYFGTLGIARWSSLLNRSEPIAHEPVEDLAPTV